MGAKYRDPTFFVVPGHVKFRTRKEAEAYAELKTPEDRVPYFVHAGSMHSDDSFIVTVFALSFGSLIKWSRKLPEVQEFINKKLGRKEFNTNVITITNK